MRTFLIGVLGLLCACGSSSGGGDLDGGGGGDGGGGDGSIDGTSSCAQTCAELGWACGYMVSCNEIVNCADEGLTCNADQVCQGGLGGQPTTCTSGGGGSCELCAAIPDCSGQPQTTELSGRVITPGRDDADTGNQVGVPNALVYILRNNNVADLPALPAGLPTAGATACDRCEDQGPLLGPVLAGAVTDAQGRFTIATDIPVGVDFLLVVKAGKFRRAVTYNLAAADACTTVNLTETLPNNPTRLPRASDDGLAVNFPRIAVTTGQIDAMECVLEKIGIEHGQFANYGGSERIHLYRGASTGSPSGMRIDSNTPHDSALYGDITRLETYDLVVADCEGGTWDSSGAQRTANGDKVREYVNRGGRLFASHLSFSWLNGNGTTAYDASTPIATGLGQAATWQGSAVTSLDSGTGIVALGRPHASPRIQHFADWMDHENVANPTAYQFTITEPRSQVTALATGTEEFVYCQGGDCTGGSVRTQQFSFNTPFGAPAAEACGRVAYSGFHVVSGGGTSPYANTVFPSGCSGDLSDQEKVLLYMLFDLGTCVGNPLPPPCVPITCDSACGYLPDGCGNVLDCGPCVVN